MEETEVEYRTIIFRTRSGHDPNDGGMISRIWLFKGSLFMTTVKSLV